MTVDIQPVVYADKLILRNLMELYLYDFSEFDGMDVNAHGRFEYRYLDHYWTEAGRFPYFIRYDGRLAGFALVRDIEGEEGEKVHRIAEFFILRKYRRKGIGKDAAIWLFKHFGGKWQVEELENNLPAQSFWRKVIGEITQGKFQEKRIETWAGPVQEFVINRDEG
ncbi:MAG: GNAT family N-acetyltransferase [Omnitrophica WOR_2 bacterium]